MSYRRLTAYCIASGALFVVTACAGGHQTRVLERPVSEKVYHTRVLDSPASMGLKPHQKPYKVNGQRYQPLATHQGFVQQGLASWYGTKFHGRKTSNGETYDMHAMTAAHKTLPLGIAVRVRNLDNGRQVVVRLNDRGPFVGDRIIDLSYAAANQLGIVKPGTAPVRIEALGYPEQLADGRTTYRPVANSQNESYAVQVASFSSDANARRLAEDLRRRFGVAGVYRSQVNGDEFFRVRVGRYASLSEAEHARLAMEGDGFRNSLVVAME